MVEVLEQPNKYHRVFDTFEEANCATLLWLNDDCLQKVFSYLELEDLCSVAEVCERFKLNAQIQFAQQHQRVRISWYGETTRSTRKMQYFERIMRNFGAFIRSLENVYPWEGNRLVELVTRYCGSELRKLDLEKVDIEDERLLGTLRPLFSRLHELSVLDCKFSILPILSSCLELQMLELNCVDVANADENVIHSIFNQNFPKLTTAAVSVDNMDEIHFENFVNMNPQLKVLAISLLNESILQVIAQSIPLIEKLELIFETGEIRLASADDLNRLSALSALTLNGICSTGMDSHNVSIILNSIANLQIKCLEFTDIFLEDEHIEQLCKLSSIEKLVFSGEIRTEFEELPNICNSLPLLEELTVNNCDEAITADELVQLIKGAKKLKSISFNKTVIDADTFDNILHIVSQREERIPLRITLHDSAEKLPQAILDAHEDFLRIIYVDLELVWPACPLRHYRRR